MRLSSITERIRPFLAMEVMERGMAMARSGVSVVQMGVGEPDFDAPSVVVEEAIRSLGAGDTHYTDSRGLLSLREAIAEECLARRGVEVSPERIVVTSGTSPALFMVLRALLDPGDEVVFATPHYPCHANMIEVCGGRPVLVPTRAEDAYRLDFDALRAAVTPRTRAILLASPANPTGSIDDPELVAGAASLGLPVLSDEIYDGLVYDGARVTSPLGLTDDCFVFDGFSKRYAMTGFRLGYVIAPAGAARVLTSMAQNLFISTSQFVQASGVAALREGAADAARMREVYARRRELMVEGLRALGFGVPHAPPGAFYVLADARRFGEDSLALAMTLLERAHVAVGPGRDFGEIAEGHLRFSFASGEERIREGLARLARVLPELG